MSKLLRLNNHHVIKNFPQGSSLLRRTLGRLAFLFLVTKVTPRHNFLTAEDYRLASGILKKGDIILTGGFRTISGFFLGKYFTHSLLYRGSGECIHADVDGVDTVALEELFQVYDNLVILRPQINHEPDQIINQALSFAANQIGKPYDFYFEHVSDRHYCTLLINTAYAQAGFNTGLNINRPKKRPVLIIRLRRALKAEDFLKGNFSLQFMSQSLKSKENQINRLIRSRKNTDIVLDYNNT